MSSDGHVPTSCSPLNCDSTVGAALIGLSIALCLYGITTGQVLLYFGRYGRGRFWFWTQCHVTAIWILDTAHTVFLAKAIFYYCVTLHGNPSHLTSVPWSYGAIVISAEASTALVRTGYAYTIWRFGNRKAPIPVVILILATLLFALGLLYGIKDMKIRSFDEVANFEWSFYAAFTAHSTVDTIIAASILFLFRGFLTGIRRFDVILQAVILCVIGAGVVSVVLTTLSLILYLVWPTTFLYMACYWVLAKLHACSFLAVLHAEKELAERASSHSQTALPMLTTALRLDDEHNTASPDRLKATKSNSCSDSSPATEGPTSSGPTEIVEVHCKSEECRVLVGKF
ncbi:hypothetical protein LXA43DRAFT_988903 [Ganoderma leucocontextum]|nr:hypothetical protein LXA43DRAFT_988903 [Ganoderma leucocontextum]